MDYSEQKTKTPLVDKIRIAVLVALFAWTLIATVECAHMAVVEAKLREKLTEVESRVDQLEEDVNDVGMDVNERSGEAEDEQREQP